MPKFRVFQVGGRRLRLVEDLETRKRDLANWSVTVQDAESDALTTYFQSRKIREKIERCPLSVKIYKTPREILESMLRAAVADSVIESAFDFSRGAVRRRTAGSETSTLRAIATEAALSSRKDIHAKIERKILLLKILSREFTGREAEEYAQIVFGKLRDLFQKIVVDVREVSYMNSSGISVLARTAGTLPTRVVGASENVRSVMDLMGLLPLLPLSESQEEALRSLEDTELEAEEESAP